VIHYVRKTNQMHTFLHNVFPVADTVRMILSATRLLLRCMVKYCKLLVQNSWWWTITWSKHVEDNLSEIREVYTLPVHLTINTPHTLNITALNMLYRTNGIVHGLTACSNDWPDFCQQLNWTELNLTNTHQQSATHGSGSVHKTCYSFYLMIKASDLEYVLALLMTYTCHTCWYA